MEHERIYVILALCIATLVAACTGMPAQTNGSAPQVNQTAQALLQATPELGKSLLKGRTVEYRNCSAKEVRQVSLASEEQVQCTVTFAEAAISASTGATLMLTPEKKNELETQTKSLFQDVYMKNISDVEQKVVEIPIDQVYTYGIFWKQLLYKSDISFVSEGLSYSVPFTYTLDIPQIELQMQHACTA
jgi:hypothetical protein